MDHLTDEQLARVALGLAEGEPLAAHVAECAACQAQLDKVSRLTDQLAAAHAEVDQTHTASRERLLAAIQQEPQPNRRAATAFRWASLLGGLNMRQRIALGGVGLSTAALVLLILILANSARELSAMERITKAVREVTSFSFTWKGRVTFPPREGKFPVIRETTVDIFWRAPGRGKEQWFGDFAAPCKIVGLEPDASGERHPELRTNVNEIYPTGKPGILIDYLHKYYFTTPPLPASELPRVHPVAMLRTVKDGLCIVVRELGTRQIGGRQARGYTLDIKEAPAFRRVHANEVEVWVDPETDLPIEFSFVESEEGEYTDVNRVVDCRWNIKLDDDLFDTTPPAGLTNSTPPTKQTEIEEIIAGLRLYAQFSGGRYPELLNFDRKAVHKELLQRAGFTGPPQPSWIADDKYQQIERATAGLERLAHVLVDKYRSGYYGEKVGPQDKGKVLFWWSAREEEGWVPGKGYRVFFGDLRSEVLTGSQLAELEPAAKKYVAWEDE